MSLDTPTRQLLESVSFEKAALATGVMVPGGGAYPATPARGRVMLTTSLVIILLSLAAGLSGKPASALSQEDFYKGKTITLIQGRNPGGLGDIRSRVVMSLLPKYIPGNPSIVTQYMPGAGGRKAANYISKSVRRDGLTLANIGAGFVSNAILEQPGVKYKLNEFVFLGSGNSRQAYVFVTRKDAGLDSLQKLRGASGLRVGGQSVGHDVSTVARLFTWLLGLKDPRFVYGYSGPEIDLALMRGEVDARGTNTATVLRRSQAWIEKDLVDFQSILEIPSGYRNPHPVFAKLPALGSFTQTKTERDVLTMYRTFRLLGSPYFLPAGVPKEREKILTRAFRKLWNDPQLPKTWEVTTGEVPFPLLPEEQTKALREIPKDAETIRIFKKIHGAGLLPPR